MWKHIINSHYFTAIYPVFLIASIIIGTIIARKTWVNKSMDWSSSGVESSVIAIFSLILSFTFFAANNLMRDRLVILNDMGDASGSLRRMSLITRDDIRMESKKFLLNYLRLVSDFKEDYLKSERDVLRDMRAINTDYLGTLMHLAKYDSAAKADILVIMPFVNKMNSSFYHLVDSYDDRTPPLIIILLVVSSLLIGTLVGFLNTFHKKKHFLVPLIFVVLVSLSIQSIRDLDNPYMGSAQPSFSDLRHQLEELQKIAY